jgi:hypothetical protein
MKLRTISLFSLIALASSSALAVPIQVIGVDTPGCDVLSVPTNMDELGRAAFPANEHIDSIVVGFSGTPACPMSATAGVASTIVRIYNLTGTSWTDLHYAAEPSTQITNDDGAINGLHAFKIDSGPGQMNNPLIFESMNANQIFEPGEFWDFLIDGYFNVNNFPEDAFDGIGVPGGPPASGNIVAIPYVPEPSCAALVLSAALLLTRRRT